MKDSTKIQLEDSVLVTVVVSVIVLMVCVLGDAASMPMQITLGASAETIEAASNLTFLKSSLLVVPGVVVGVFLFSFLMLKFLRHGETLKEYKNRR